MPNRRQFLRGALSLGVLGSVAVCADAFIEPFRPTVKRVEVFLRRLPAELDGLTVAHLSDFHYDAYAVEVIREAVQRTNDLNPDLIVLTGDFVTVPFIGKTRLAADDALPCAQILGGLQAPLGIFAVLGNHDFNTDPQRVAHALVSRGIVVLRNFNVEVEHNGVKLWLAGVDDVLHRGADLKKAMSGIPSGDTCILLAHEPDFADIASGYPIDLQLSGHSHGGQVRLPLLGTPYLPVMARKYPCGLRQVGSMALYTNCGIGTIFLPVRFDTPPEITLLTLSLQHRSPVPKARL